MARLFGAPAGVEAVATGLRSVAEVFTPNATRAMELSQAAQSAALQQMAAEFGAAGSGPFDRVVNGLNRLPRPCLAFGTIGLFVYAMADPVGFGARMVGLQAIPEPLWWLMGAIVAFYFGARESHYFRTQPAESGQAAGPAPTPTPPVTAAGDDNPALRDWQRLRGQQGA